RSGRHIGAPLKFGSVVASMPEEDGVLDDHGDGADREEVPARDVVVDQAKEEEKQREDDSREPACARRAEPMREEAFVHETGKAGHGHFSFEEVRVKIASVGSPKTRANVSASSRLGT